MHLLVFFNFPYDETFFRKSVRNTAVRDDPDDLFTELLKF